MNTTRNLWRGLAALLVTTFAVLLWMGSEIHRQEPPMPASWSPRTGTCSTRAPTSRPAARSGKASAASSSARSGATAHWWRRTGAPTCCIAKRTRGSICAHSRIPAVLRRTFAGQPGQAAGRVAARNPPQRLRRLERHTEDLRPAGGGNRQGRQRTTKACSATIRPRRSCARPTRCATTRSIRPNIAAS